MERSNWHWIFIICGALAFSCWHSFAAPAEIRYISETERGQLKSDFDTAKPLTQLSGKWTCDMYGVSSHLQVVKSVHLYAFESNKNTFQNRGAQAQIVPVYKSRNGEMTGVGQKIEDRLRQSKDGQLFSKLSHEGQVIAYSRCRPG